MKEFVFSKFNNKEELFSRAHKDLVSIHFVLPFPLLCSKYITYKCCFPYDKIYRKIILSKIKKTDISGLSYIKLFGLLVIWKNVHFAIDCFFFMEILVEVLIFLFSMWIQITRILPQHISMLEFQIYVLFRSPTYN